MDRNKLARAMGALATMLPMAVGMILFNGLNPTGIFFTIGLFYLLTGLYYRAAVPIEPMKLVAAYAIATGVSSDQVLAAGLIVGLVLLAIGIMGNIEGGRRWVPPPVVLGLQAAAGLLLMTHGIRLMTGSTKLQVLCQAVEPHLRIQSLGPLPLGVVIGIAGLLTALLLMENRRLPAGLALITAGIALGLALGTYEGLDKLRPGIYLPRWLAYGFPAAADLGFALMALVLPQVPVTLKNTVLAVEHLGPKARRVTPRALCIGMGIVNLAGFVLGGIPLGHGTGEPAGHDRFRDRKSLLNLVVGTGLAALALLFGFHVLSLIHLMPLAILGVLFLLIGGQLSLGIADAGGQKNLLLAVITAGIALASNLAIGLLVGIGMARFIRSEINKT